MADFARFLPLSQRRTGDESSVTTDRRAQIADLVDAAARMPAVAADPELARAFLADAGIPAEDPDLRATAERVRSGPRRRIRDLARTTRALLVLADRTGTTVSIPPPVAGAVALYRTTNGPFDRRAVVRGHTVRAVDQEWSFGSGPVLEASAEQVLRFLLALSDIPPRPPVARSEPETTVEG